MEDLLAGRLTFKVKNSHDEIVDGTVVLYPSDEKYYVQADGSMLWQVQPIQQGANTVILTPSQTITSGFSLVGVQINVIGAFIRENNNHAKYVVNEDGKLVCYYGNDEQGLVMFALNKQGNNYYPIFNQESPSLFNEWGFMPYGNAQSPTSDFEITVNHVTYNGVYNGNRYTITPDIVNEYQP